MSSLVIDIENFLLTSNLARRTKKIYRRRLIEFTQYLSQLINEPIESVDLLKIYYIPYDDNNCIYEQIDSTILDEFFEAHLSRGYSWLSSMKSALCTLFKYLSTTYNLENVMHTIEFQLEDHKQEPKIKRVLNRQEILKLIMSVVKYSDNVERDCLLFVTLLSTGCRINEVLCLKRRDIHTENNVFFLKNTKNKRSMFVVTKIGLTNVIETYCMKNNLNLDDYIFTSTNGNKNKPISQKSVNELLRYYLEKESIPPTRVHDTRRSFATVMYENGTDIDVIRQLLNHETINSTKIYIDDNYVRNASIQIPMYDTIFADMRKMRLKQFR